MKSIASTRHLLLASAVALLLMTPTCNCNEKEASAFASFLRSINGGNIIEFTTTEVHLYAQGGCQMIVDISLDGDQWIYFCLDGNVAQTYSLNPSNSQGNVSARFQEYAADLFGTAGSITIEQVDMNEGTVRGTFSCSLTDAASGDLAQCTDGSFHIEKGD